MSDFTPRPRLASEIRQPSASQTARLASSTACGNTWTMSSAAVVVLWAAWAVVGHADEGSTGGWEKRAASADRSSSETSGAKPVARKLIPFEEDEQSQGSQAAPRPTRLPSTAQGNRSNFQPRFKTPAVRRAQHVDGGASPQGEPQGSSPASPSPSAPSSSEGKPASATTPGQALVEEAFAKSKTAKSDADYTEVIDLCRRGLQTGLKKNYQDYTRHLLGWSYNRRGEARVQRAKEAEALADFEAAVEADPNSWRAVHNRGVSYAAAGRMKEALTDFNRTIDLHPKYPNAFFNRAELKYRQGDFQGAVEDYTAALEISPRDPTVFNARGHAFYRIQQFGEALRDYSAAIRLDPKFAPAMINRADAYSDLGRYSEAANDYREAVEADPGSWRAYQAVAWLMATCPDDHYRNEKLALEAAQKAIELTGEADFRCLETLAAAQANAGKFAEAQATQELAIAKAPRAELVSTEKRMALYQRDLAFRERPRIAYKTPEEQEAKQVRKASGTAPLRGRGRPPANRYMPRPQGS
jgi:tetratricopeptide (TPR) repeat protein